MKNKDNLDSKKEKKLNKIKEQLARLREKLASENKHPSFPSKPKFEKTKDWLGKKLSSSGDQMDQLVNILEERSIWQRYGF